MAVSTEFLEFACEVFVELGPVVAKRMFGGAGLYAEGVMFALVADEGIYLKAEGELADALGRNGSKPFIFTDKKGKSAAMGYYQLPEICLDDPEVAASWARQSLALAHSKRR